MIGSPSFMKMFQIPVTPMYSAIAWPVEPPGAQHRVRQTHRDRAARRDVFATEVVVCVSTAD